MTAVLRRVRKWAWGRGVVAALGAAAAATVFTSMAWAQCPYMPACPDPCTMCRVPPAMGTNPSVPTMSALFDQIARGPRSYGSLGWDFGGRDTFGAGPGWCGRSGPRETVPCHFPCLLLKAIYLTESSWRQFCDSGRTVVSFDCGYGIAQVTSGMRRGETSAFDPERVAASPAYNVSVGAAILADKWRISPCVGDNDPDVIEDWYFAVWGYNGFSYRNNPNNPMYAADRVEFRTPGVPSAQVRGNYPYQELVWGFAHYPLSSAHYTGLGLAYPDRSEICSSCGFPTMHISEPRGAHRSVCSDGTVPDAGSDAGVRDASMADTGVRSDGGAGRDGGTDASPGHDGGDADLEREGTLDAGVSIDTGSDGRSGRDGGLEGRAIRGGCGCSVPGLMSEWRFGRGVVLAVLAIACGIVRWMCRGRGGT